MKIYILHYLVISNNTIIDGIMEDIRKDNTLKIKSVYCLFM